MLRVLVPAGAAVTIIVPLTLGTLPGAGAGPDPAQAAASASPAASPETTYPYAIASRVGPWGFPTRHSTDYVAWRLYERDVVFHKTMRGPNGKTGDFGAPGEWAANALKTGFSVDQSPKAGSIAQWNAGEGGAGRTGHVAYVEQVYVDGSVLISEFDWSGGYEYSERGQAGNAAVRAPRYIHIDDQ
jgi:surface antigen